MIGLAGITCNNGSIGQSIWRARDVRVRYASYLLQKPWWISLPKVSEQVAVSHLDWKESQKAMLEHLSKEPTLTIHSGSRIRIPFMAPARQSQVYW